MIVGRCTAINSRGFFQLFYRIQDHPTQLMSITTSFAVQLPLGASIATVWGAVRNFPSRLPSLTLYLLTIETSDNHLLKKVPLVVCHPTTVSLNSSGMAVLNTSQASSTPTTCGALNLFFNQTNFNCSDIGTKEVLITATDGFGNSTNCQAAVSVEYTIPPLILSCNSVSVSLNSSGLVTINLTSVVSVGTPGCGMNATIVGNKTTFGCSDVGINYVNFTITDSYNNNSTCISQVTVKNSPNSFAVCSPTCKVLLPFSHSFARTLFFSRKVSDH